LLRRTTQSEVIEPVEEVMKIVVCFRMLLCFLGLQFLFLASLARAQQAQPAAPAQQAQPPGSIVLGPYPISQNVQGVTVNTQVRLTFSLVTEQDGLHLAALMNANFSDLQNKFAQLVSTIPLPRDNCKSYTLGNPVVSLGNESLRAEGANAVIGLSGKVDAWTCLENPIPETYWDSTGCRGDLPFGGHYIFGCPKTRPGSPIKTIALTQPFDATLPVSLQIVGENRVGLVMGQPNVHLGGQFVFITNAILKIAGISINDEAKKALDQAIDPNKLIATIPSEYAALQPKILDAHFESNQGQLNAVLSMTALVPPADLSKMIEDLINGLKKPN
jgi:hypothetical protein